MKRAYRISFFVFFVASGFGAVLAMRAGTLLGVGLFTFLACFFLWHTELVHIAENKPLERRWKPGGEQ